MSAINEFAFCFAMIERSQEELSLEVSSLERLSFLISSTFAKQVY